MNFSPHLIGYILFHSYKFLANVTADQWPSTCAKSPPRRRFYVLWGRFCDLEDLGAISVSRGRFRLKHTTIWNLF